MAGTGYMYNNIKNISNGVITIDWQVVSHDFPPDWQATFAVCDNITCYYNSNGSLMNVNGTGTAPKTTDTFGPGRSSLFYILMNLSNAQPGTHYVKINMTDGSTSKDSWYFVSKWPNGVVSVEEADEQVLVYPNPASNELNILSASQSGIQKIEMLNMQGVKVAQTESQVGKTTKLNVENIPGGMYLIKVLDGVNQVIKTVRVDHK